MRSQRPSVGHGPAGVLPDPGIVGTIEELKKALHALKAAAGLRGPKAVEDAAGRLDGSLPKTTVSDMLSKGRPSRETLATFLRVCGVPRGQHEAWQAARSRALGHGSELGLGPLIGLLLRVDDADPRDLGVHAAIDVLGADGDLPTYVERDTDLAVGGLRERIRQAVTTSVLVVVATPQLGECDGLRDQGKPGAARPEEADP
ncbi:hypothetical protein [Nonomuraea sp. NPDC023979]|uniref:hypothetical protein n=1 Tax=Nonomuraea sp. NPDC023979 TaxID=3154796 RepID=UPI0033F2BA43